MLWQLTQSEVDVPGRDGIRSALWPIASGLLGAVIPSAARCAYMDIHRLSHRPIFFLRSTFACLLCGTVAVAAVTLNGTHPEMITLRNSAFVIGLSLLSVSTLRSTYQWIPPVFVPICMWLLGSQPAGRQAASWAVMLQGPNVASSIIVSYGLLIVGTLVYVTREMPMRRC